jgi:hypothetical protein
MLSFDSTYIYPISLLLDHIQVRFHFSHSWCLLFQLLLIIILILLTLWFLVDHLHQTCLQRQFLLVKSVLLPGVVLDLHVIAVSDHALFEKSE